MIDDSHDSERRKPRVIPTLLLKGTRLIKTVRFEDPIYLGDPMNAVRIFKDKFAEELFVIDVDPSTSGLEPRFDFIREIAEESGMSVTYFGGVSSKKTTEKLLASGVERIGLGAAAAYQPQIIGDLSREFGSNRIVVGIDVRGSDEGSWKLHSRDDKKRITERSPKAYAIFAVELGAGEIFLTSVDREGTGSGFDLPLIRDMSTSVNVPVVAHGGASSNSDLVRAFEAGAAAVAAGSMFSFVGRKKGVLISYPSSEEILALRP